MRNKLSCFHQRFIGFQTEFNVEHIVISYHLLKRKLVNTLLLWSNIEVVDITFLHNVPCLLQCPVHGNVGKVAEEELILHLNTAFCRINYVGPDVLIRISHLVSVGI